MKDFSHFIQNEIYNLFHSKAFRFVLLVLFVLIIADTVLAYKLYNDNILGTINSIETYSDGTYKVLPFLQVYTTYNSWIGGRVNQTLPMIFFYTLPLYVTIPYSWSYLSEQATGYDRIMVSALSKKKYFFGKYISVFISGFLTVLIPMIFSYLLVSCLIPAYKPDVDFDLYYQIGITDLFRNLYYSRPLLTVVLNMLMASFFGGAWATIPYAFSFFEKNKFVVMIGPYLLLMYLISSLETALAYHSYAETSIIYYIWLASPSTNEYWGVYFLMMAVIFFPPLIVVLERGKHADVY